jgi:predicted ATPase/DNA-binding SARP family transcriptional activator
MRVMSCMRPAIKILGPLELIGADGRVGLRRLKARQLLLLLVAERNRLVPREALIDALWPGSLPSYPGASLRSYASTVHRAVDSVPGVRITSDRTGYMLRVGNEMIDDFCFEQFIHQARAEQAGQADINALECLDRALTLVRGKPFEDAAEIAATAGEVRRLESLMMAAREQRLEVQLSLGRQNDAVADAQILVAENPYRERLWELYALGLCQCGHTAAALDAIDRIRQSLRDRFGIDVAPSLARLEADLRNGRGVGLAPRVAVTTLSASSAWRPRAASGPGSAVSVARTSGPLVGEVLGRDADLCRLEMLLGTARLTTLIGPGGVGKTRLAVEVVRRAEGSHVPFWCDLATAETPDDVQQLVAASLGVLFERGRPARRTLATFVSSKQILLVLDTCDLAVSAVSDIVEHLLANCPRLVILATSREPLHLPNEELFEVKPLRVPERDDQVRQEELDLAPAAALLELRYREADGADPGTHLGPREAQLSRALDGLPLAIELAAGALAASEGVSRAKMHPGTLDLTELGSSAGRQAARPARHQTMRRTIGWSYRSMSSAERRVLEAVASFAGSFTLDQAIAETSSVCLAGELVASLTGLIDKSMLQVGDVGGRSWYRLPNLARAYVRERRRAKPRRSSPAATGRPVKGWPGVCVP